MGQGLEDLDPDVLVSFVSDAEVHVVDHACDHLLGVADHLEGVVVVTGLGLDSGAERHKELEEFCVGLLRL